MSITTKQFQKETDLNPVWDFMVEMKSKKRKSFLIIIILVLVALVAAAVYFFQFNQYGYIVATACFGTSDRYSWESRPLKMGI